MFGPPLGTGTAHIVQFRAVGVGEGLHQVFADLHNPVHDGPPGLVVVASTCPLVGCRSAQVHAAAAGCALGHYGLPSAASVAKSAANLPQKAKRAMNGRQFVYHMQGLTKTYPGNRKVLENIHLSFYPDAKIGVLGVNGSGKSTLLRIMAGIDKEFVGEGWVAEGARVGYLEQEPQLDPKLSVRENVMQGVAAKKALLDRYNEIAANYTDETAEEMAKLQDEIDAKNLWELDSQVDLAMEALRCPPDDWDVSKL